MANLLAFWLIVQHRGLIKGNKVSLFVIEASGIVQCNTVEPRYNEVLGTMKITSLYQGKKQRNIKSWDQQNYLVIRGFCYIRPLYNEVPLYLKSSLYHLLHHIFNHGRNQKDLESFSAWDGMTIYLEIMLTPF